ncbi:MAG: aminodeoxyfutalosine synthase [Planctomycetota bacterium]|jgi:aminodeoxyfutalosine synthase
MNTSIMQERCSKAGLDAIYQKVMAGKRLSTDDGIQLYNTPDLHAVGALANFVRDRMHGDDTFFNVNQHINYTNVCNKLCRFCSFQRLPGQEGAYVMKPEEVATKIREQLDEPVTEVHVVGGVYPRLPYSYYIDILQAIKKERPGIHIKSFTMVELMQIARLAKKPLAEVLPELQAAGLGSCPGGGAEVFAKRVHDEGYHKKNTGEEWIEAARTVHEAGIKSNCTMLHGHIETIEERVDHLNRLRLLQDETGGFQTYIPLSFHNAGNEWSHLPGPTAMDELREIAIGRLMLDNIPHVKAYWIMLGIPIAQTALSFGANDVDGTVVEEKIYHEAGAQTPQAVKREELVRWIRDAGRTPVERDTIYNELWRATDTSRAAV